MVITPGCEAGVVEATRATLAGTDGRRVTVQLRAKDATARELVGLGHALRAVTRHAGARLVVNGRADVARAVGADGVHLPESALPPAEVRTLLGPEALVGVSCHDAQGMAQAAREGADYIVLAPFGQVQGKNPPLGPSAFAERVRGCPLPVLALGGIGVPEAAAAAHAGAAGVAVIRAVYRAGDPAAAARDLLDALDTTQAGEK